MKTSNKRYYLESITIQIMHLTTAYKPIIILPLKKSSNLNDKQFMYCFIVWQEQRKKEYQINIFSGCKGKYPFIVQSYLLKQVGN